MNFLTVVLCGVALQIHYVFTWAINESLSTKIHQVCKRKTRISEADIEKGQRGLFDINNPKQTCYMKCVLSKVLIMDEKGNLTPERAKIMVPPELAFTFEAGLTLCGFIVESNACKKAMKIYECIHKNYPTFFYLP